MTMALTEHSIKMLCQLQRYILAEPKRFNLSLWGISCDPKAYKKLHATDEDAKVLKKQRPPCGSVGCLAGNVLVMTGKIVPSRHFDGKEIYDFPETSPDLAQQRLGLDDEQARRLFYLTRWGFHLGWPDKFARRLDQCSPGTKAYAKVASDRIDHYIATGGEE